MIGRPDEGAFGDPAVPTEFAAGFDTGTGGVHSLITDPSVELGSVSGFIAETALRPR